MGPKLLRVLLIDDDPAVLVALRRLLTPYVDVVGVAATGATGVQLSDELSPHLVVVDGNLPDIKGIEVTRRIRSLPRSPQVISFTAMHGMRFAMLKAGAVECVHKSSPDELIAAIKKIAVG